MSQSYWILFSVTEAHHLFPLLIPGFHIFSLSLSLPSSSLGMNNFIFLTTLIYLLLHPNFPLSIPFYVITVSPFHSKSVSIHLLLILFSVYSNILSYQSSLLSYIFNFSFSDSLFSFTYKEVWVVPNLKTFCWPYILFLTSALFLSVLMIQVSSEITTVHLHILTIFLHL